MRELCHDKLVHMTALRLTGSFFFAVRAPVCDHRHRQADMPVYLTGIFSNKTFATAISMSNHGNGSKINFIVQSPNNVHHAIVYLK